MDQRKWTDMTREEQIDFGAKVGNWLRKLEGSPGFGAGASVKRRLLSPVEIRKIVSKAWRLKRVPLGGLDDVRDFERFLGNEYREADEVLSRARLGYTQADWALKQDEERAAA